MTAEPKHVDLRAASLVTLMAFLWAGNPIAIKLVLEDAPSIRQAWMRLILGGLTILLWARITGTSIVADARRALRSCRVTFLLHPSAQNCK